MTNIVQLFPRVDNDTLSEKLRDIKAVFQAKIFCNDCIGILELMKETTPEDHEITISNIDSLIEYYLEHLENL